MLKIQFLGTGTSQGIPIIANDHPVNFSNNKKDKRLRSSVLLTKNNKNIAIDCGPDFRYQMLRSDVQSLEGVLFTHEHTDHVLGIDDTRPFIHRSGKPLDVFGNERTLNDIRLRFPYVFAKEKYPGAPSLNEHIIGLEVFEFAELQIEALPIMHGKLPIYGYLIDNRFAYITDASSITEEVINKIKNVDVLVLNALRKSPKHYSHFTLNEALEAADLIQPKKCFFTHISVELGFHDEVEAELPTNRFLAYDGLELHL